MVDKITINRWEDAQDFELAEWKNNQDYVVNVEWQEAEKKLKKLFGKIAKKINLKSSDRVLDVGCGPTVPARLMGGTIVGIEPLADELGISGKGIVAKNVEIVDGKAEAMPFGKNEFRVVVCRNVIDHTENPNQIIEEIYRVTKNEGYLMLICYIYAPFITFVKNLSEKVGFMNNRGHPFTFTDKTLEKLVDNKFEIVERYTIHTGQHSTDYGKVDIEPDKSMVNHLLIWINKNVFRSQWFVKEYGFLARKK